jgi:hypothetical protein
VADWRRDHDGTCILPKVSEPLRDDFRDQTLLLLGNAVRLDPAPWCHGRPDHVASTARLARLRSDTGHIQRGKGPTPYVWHRPETRNLPSGTNIDDHGHAAGTADLGTIVRDMVVNVATLLRMTAP